MKFFSRSKDGGPDSTVTAYWLFEIKSLFSIALLRFEDGSRDEYHSHAFNSVSWLLSGGLSEQHRNQYLGVECHYPGIRPIITKRSTFHRVWSGGRSWVLTFRGPWSKTWREYDPRTREFSTLAHGRKIIGGL